MPHFITETCIGCGVCEIKCPTHTITGDKAEKYVIHADRCIDCSVCARYCPVSCIEDQRGELVEKVKPRDIPKAIVDRDLCTGCEFCIDICPFDCIYLIDDPLQETFHKIAEVDAGPCARRTPSSCPTLSLRPRGIFPSCDRRSDIRARARFPRDRGRRAPAKSLGSPFLSPPAPRRRHRSPDLSRLQLHDVRPEKPGRIPPGGQGGRAQPTVAS